MRRAKIKLGSGIIIARGTAIHIEGSLEGMPDLEMDDVHIEAGKAIFYKEIDVTASGRVEVPKELLDKMLDLLKQEGGNKPRAAVEAAAQKSGLMGWLKTSRPTDWVEALDGIVSHVFNGLAGQ